MDWHHSLCVSTAWTRNFTTGTSHSLPAFFLGLLNAVFCKEGRGGPTQSFTLQLPVVQPASMYAFLSLCFPLISSEFHMLIHALSKLIQMVTLQTCIQEVPTSDLNQDTNYNDWGFIMVFLSPSRQNPGVPQNWPQLAPSTVLSNSLLSFIQLFSATYPELLVLSLKKPQQNKINVLMHR
jgi:hypothetical protein